METEMPETLWDQIQYLQATGLSPSEVVEKAKEKWRVHYEVIGEFIVNFSVLDFYIKQILTAMSGVDLQYQGIIYSTMDLAAACDQLKAVCAIKFKDDKPRIKKINTKLNAVQTLANSHRNAVAHALWTPQLQGMVAMRTQRKTGEVAYLYEDPTDLKKAASEASDLAVEMTDLFVWIEKVPGSN
jgi:hypothetical protein